MAGPSRSNNGVASLADVPAILFVLFAAGAFVSGRMLPGRGAGEGPYKAVAHQTPIHYRQLMLPVPLPLFSVRARSVLALALPLETIVRSEPATRTNPRWENRH